LHEAEAKKTSGKQKKEMRENGGFGLTTNKQDKKTETFQN